MERGSRNRRNRVFLRCCTRGGSSFAVLFSPVFRQASWRMSCTSMSSPSSSSGESSWRERKSWKYSLNLAGFIALKRRGSFFRYCSLFLSAGRKWIQKKERSGVYPPLPPWRIPGGRSRQCSAVTSKLSPPTNISSLLFSTKISSQFLMMREICPPRPREMRRPALFAFNWIRIEITSFLCRFYLLSVLYADIPASQSFSAENKRMKKSSWKCEKSE